ncbi:MAG: aldose 1-epimerase [Cyclobacteriaceae bacterium]
MPFTTLPLPTGMFDQRTEPFGSLEQITFFNDSSGDLISFLPSYGACITRLVFKGTNIIDGFSDYEMLQTDERFRSAWLFPWVNRIKDGKYSFEGREYQLPVNEKQRNTALHGFAFGQKFILEDVGLSENIATARFTYRYDGHFPGYPFPFDLELDYVFSGKEGFTANYQVTNQGKFNMPFGAGFHPYFCFDDRDVSGWHLQLPDIKHHFLTDERLIPTGETVSFDHFTQPKPLGDIELDHCFALAAEDEKVETILYDAEKKQQIRVWQECGEDQFNFLQVFIPPTRDVIALETISSGIDAFNNGQGLIIIEPGQSREASMGIQMTHSG